MAYTSRPITANESTAGLRTVVFAVWNTDGTAKADLAAATALIHTNGTGAGTASTNNFAHLSNGRYGLVLTQSEVNLTVGTHLLIGPANGSGYVVTPAEAVIVAATVTATVQAIDSAERAALADAFLNRDMATGTDSGSTTVRTVRQALRALRNRFVVSGGTATFYKEDDSTVSHTAVLMGTPAVTEANPAGGS